MGTCYDCYYRNQCSYAKSINYLGCGRFLDEGKSIGLKDFEQLDKYIKKEKKEGAMLSEDFYKLIEKELLPQCFEIMKSKGEAYSGQEDKLGNFKRCAKLAGVSTKKAWFIYFTKHFDALSSYIRGEYKDSESIDGRIKDMINYLFLIYGMIKEEEESVKCRFKDGEENNAIC